MRRRCSVLRTGSVTPVDWSRERLISHGEGRPQISRNVECSQPARGGQVSNEAAPTEQTFALKCAPQTGSRTRQTPRRCFRDVASSPTPSPIPRAFPCFPRLFSDSSLHLRSALGARAAACDSFEKLSRFKRVSRCVLLSLPSRRPVREPETSVLPRLPLGHHSLLSSLVSPCWPSYN